MSVPPRRVSVGLVMDVDEAASVAIQLAVADRSPTEIDETLTILSNGRPVDVDEVVVAGNGRVHVLGAAPGRLEVHYDAVVTGSCGVSTVHAAERLVYLRPSRYAEADRLAPIAQAEFAGITDAAELLVAVSSWVGSRLAYVPGSSGPTDGAVDTMLHRRGVCRDYAHLVIALLRALDVPARLVSAYAPGLDPMDFHAVAEVAVDGVWRIVDATLLAPRASLVRIATGRDAADTAFLSTYGGRVDLLDMRVTATIDGRLPGDDITQLVSLS